MRVLAVGGSGSGKSAYAERLACELSPIRTYVATMESVSTEAQARIERHRAQRADMRFRTIECPRELPLLSAPTSAAGVALVEDVGNLVANTLFLPNGDMRDTTDLADSLTRDILTLSRAFEHMVVVGNEVGTEGMLYDETTLVWVRLVGALCCRLAAQFDMVVEVIAGLPCVVKGSWA